MTASWQLEYSILADALLAVVSGHTTPAVRNRFFRVLGEEVSKRRRAALRKWAE